MNYEDMKKLHTLATEARDASHKAYQAALDASRGDNTVDIEPAFQALLMANRVKARIYRLMTDMIASGSSFTART